MFHILHLLKKPHDPYEKNLVLFQGLGTFPLPDFADCRLPDGHCSCMTPQGICATQNYIVITAYCNINRFKSDLEKSLGKSHLTESDGSQKNILSTAAEKSDHGSQTQILNEILYHKIENEPVHHSCLMVFSKNDFRQLAVLELPDQNHVGGIAYDGNHIWIAKSTDQCLSVIKESDLEKTIRSITSSEKYVSREIHTSSIDKKGNYMKEKNSSEIPSSKIAYFQKKVPCGMTASFVTYHAGRIFVGYCAPARKKGMLQSFQIQKNPRAATDYFSLQPERKLGIPAHANGASFYSTYLFLSISGGRNIPSKMLIYRIESGKNSTLFKKKRLHRFFLPPLLEESCIDQGILYTLYESSSPAYRDVSGNQCTDPVEVVSMADPRQLISPLRTHLVC